MAQPLSFLPYGCQVIEDDDVAAVASVLRGDYLTTGPAVADFEQALAAACGARFAVACANGTAALHLANLTLGIGEGDTVIVPAITFLATANAARYVGAEVLFADVDPQTGIMMPEQLEQAFARAKGRGVKAVFPVALGGQAADRHALGIIAAQNGARVIDDACHALGSKFDEMQSEPGRAGDCRHAVMTAFSFHPVKTIAMGEGGAVTTNSESFALRLKTLRSHGMTREPTEFEIGGVGFDVDGAAAPWAYEMQEPGYNYRASDIACALGLSQLRKLSRFVSRRRELVEAYDSRIAELERPVWPVRRLAGNDPCMHLYVVLIDFVAAGRTRTEVVRGLAERGIGTQVHYIPVCHQPYYRRRYGRAEVPGADLYYSRCLTLPLHAAMTDTDVMRVVDALGEVLSPAGGVRRAIGGG